MASVTFLRSVTHSLSPSLSHIYLYPAHSKNYFCSIVTVGNKYSAINLEPFPSFMNIYPDLLRVLLLLVLFLLLLLLHSTVLCRLSFSRLCFNCMVCQAELLHMYLSGLRSFRIVHYYFYSTLTFVLPIIQSSLCFPFKSCNYYLTVPSSDIVLLHLLLYLGWTHEIRIWIG